MSKIAAGTNRCMNPSAETNTTGWSVSQGTLATDTSDAWSGAACFKMTLTARASTPYTMVAATSTNSQRISVVPGQIVNVTARLRSSRANEPFQWQVQFYAADGITTVGTITVSPSTPVLSSGWTRVSASDIEAPASAAFVQTMLRWVNTATCQIGDILRFDGVDVRLDQDVDTYIDGDQGSAYFWNGTPHASTSTRVSLTAQEGKGKGGLLTMIPSLYRATKSGRIVEDLSEYLVEGSVSFRGDSDTHMIFDATFTEPWRVEPLVDYLVPRLRIEYADGSSVDESLGLFIAVPGTESATYQGSKGTIEGRSREWLLSIDGFDSGYHVLKGVDPVAAVIRILRDYGYTPFSISPSGKKIKQTRAWKEGTPKLTVINELLLSVNYYPLHTRRDGYLVSSKKRHVTRSQSSFTLTSDVGKSNVTGFVESTPDVDAFANKVVVIYTNPKADGDAADADPKLYKAVNRNPNSLASTVRLGLTKTIYKDVTTRTDSSTLKDIAETTLADASMRKVKLKVSAVPDPTRAPFEIATLRILQSDARQVAMGSYAVQGWTLGLRPSQGAMTYDLYRVEAWE